MIPPQRAVLGDRGTWSVALNSGERARRPPGLRSLPALKGVSMARSIAAPASAQFSRCGRPRRGKVSEMTRQATVVISTGDMRSSSSGMNGDRGSSPAVCLEIDINWTTLGQFLQLVPSQTFECLSKGLESAAKPQMGYERKLPHSALRRFQHPVIDTPNGRRC
jgi:hypothetical protein